MARKKPDPLPAEPLEALASINGLAEEVKCLAEEARRYADNALDKAQDAAEKAESLYHLLDEWFVDRRRRGEPEPKAWQE
jgi:hypothetical protein